MRLIRRLAAGDVPALQRHLLGLSQVDRRLRFCMATPDSLIRRYCAELDWIRSVLLGCFSGGKLIGAAHLLWTETSSTGPVELALSVDREEQGKGIGTELVARAAASARLRGVRQLCFVCPAENEAMQRLALKMGGRLVTDGEQVDGTIDIWGWESEPGTRLGAALRRLGNG